MEWDAGAESEIAEGRTRTVEVGDRTLLLAKVRGVCHAVGATCPHAGGPLGEGVLRGDVVICPWHKAAFSVITGKRSEPPAVDDLPRFACRIADGRILVDTEDRPPDIQAAEPFSSRDPRCMVIVGSGAAGAVAAQTLREEGFRGRVVLVSQDQRLPYDRTVLSKYALSGKKGGEKTPLQDAGFYERLAIERLTRTVAAIEPAARRMVFEDGGALDYDVALVATGGIPRRLQVPGADLPGVFTLRSAADAEAIAAAAASARSAVIAGSGFIAMEAAASLRERGLEVTVVAPQAVPFERQLGRDVGQVFRRAHEHEGIAFRLEDEIVAVEGDRQVQRVRLKSRGLIETDLVVVGLGVEPASGLVRDVPLRDDGGLSVDATLRVADRLYAAGDIAAFPLLGDGDIVRVEHWRVAEQHGRVAALNMLGGDVAYDAVPYFWTIHFMKRLDYVGHAEGWDDIVVDGDLQEPRFLAFYVQNGSVAAVAGWDRDRQMAAAVALMTERKRWPVAELRAELAAYA